MHALLAKLTKNRWSVIFLWGTWGSCGIHAILGIWDSNPSVGTRIFEAAVVVALLALVTLQNRVINEQDALLQMLWRDDHGW